MARNRTRPWGGQTVRFIHSPTELSWPGPRREQAVGYIHSPTELSWPRPWGGQTEIHSFSHRAIMTPALGRTDRETHSFSHRAIKTPALGRTDSEIHSFSHRAIMTRATERTGSGIHSFSHWAIMNPGHGENQQWDTFILPLNYHEPGPWGGQVVRYIHSPTELSRARAMGRTDSEIHSFSQWAIMNPGQGEDRQWDTFILPLSYHEPRPRREHTVR